MKKLEFSKLLALIITILFSVLVCFIAVIWAITNKTPEQLQVGINILGVVATPFGVVITGYLAKAGVENYQKIKKGGKDNEGNS